MLPQNLRRDHEILFIGSIYKVESTRFVYDDYTGEYVGDVRNIFTGETSRFGISPSEDVPVAIVTDWHNDPRTHSYA